MYIFSQSISEAVNHSGNVVTPLEPPYVQVVQGKHTLKQKLGSYLSKSYPNEPALVKKLVEEYKEINGDLTDYRIEHTTDYVEIYQHDLYAIDSTSKSCMTGSDSVRVYDYDERLSLLVAYKDSKLVLRTLVRSDKMEYVRIYIDHNFVKTHIAKAIVAKAGYTEGDLEDIKLEFIEENKGIVCPYIDKTYNFDLIDESYLVISSNGEFESTASGYVDREDMWTCEHCGERVHVDDIEYVGYIATCEDCLYRNYVWYNDAYYDKDNCVTNNSNGELIPLDCVDDADVSCTEDGEWYDRDEVICIDGCCYHEGDCVRLVQEDSNKNEYALTDDAIYNSEELDMLASGYWLKEQIQEVLTELNETLDSLQTDLFEDKDIIELTTEEIDTLVVEIVKIELLIG